MPTFTRSISKLEAEDSDGLTAVAHTAHWRVTCVEDSEVQSYGTAPLGDPDPDNFTALDDVTEAEAQAWLGDDFWSGIETKLTEQYNAKQASTKVEKTFTA
jgi:hypothetical protein